MHRLVAEDPVRAGGQAVEQAARAEEVDVGEGAVEEQPLDHRREADQVEQELATVLPGLELVEVEDRVDPPEAEVRLGLDRGDVVDRRERLVPLGLVGHVGVEQGQVELHVHRLLEELAGEVEPTLGGVDVLVEVQHQVVGHDRVAGGEERDQPRDQVPLGVAEPLEVLEVGVQVDLLDGPGVLDRVAVAVVEVRVAHRPQGQVHPGVEQHRGVLVVGAHWQASQLSGFSSEQASASSSEMGVMVRGARRRQRPGR